MDSIRETQKCDAHQGQAETGAPSINEDAHSYDEAVLRNRHTRQPAQFDGGEWHLGNESRAATAAVQVARRRGLREEQGNQMSWR